MYGYESTSPYVTTKGLLLQYSQEEIFKIAMGEYPSLSRYYVSPFRKDTNPGCYFEWYKEKLYFIDFGDAMTHRDCFNFIGETFGITSFYDIGQFIVEYFEHNTTLVPASIERPYSEEYKEKRRAQITFKRRTFDGRDPLFWSQYQITMQQLLSDNVFPISSFRIFSEKDQRWRTMRPFTVSYAIGGFEDRCKIYTPYAKKQLKWFTNCTKNDVGGLSTLITSADKLIITKSYKDWRVLTNMGYVSVWFQNEGMFPDISILLDLIDRFSVIYIFFDNDETGLLAAEKLSNHIMGLKEEKEIHRIVSPYSYLKDPADIISVKGEQELKQFLWKHCQV